MSTDALERWTQVIVHCVEQATANVSPGSERRDDSNLERPNDNEGSLLVRLAELTYDDYGH